MADKVIVIPLDVFETAESKEDLEDWLLAQNPGSLKGMKKARKDDLHGLGKNWEEGLPICSGKHNSTNNSRR